MRSPDAVCHRRRRPDTPHPHQFVLELYHGRIRQRSKLIRRVSAELGDNPDYRHALLARVCKGNCSARIPKEVSASPVRRRLPFRRTDPDRVIGQEHEQARWRVGNRNGLMGPNEASHHANQGVVDLSFPLFGTCAYRKDRECEDRNTLCIHRQKNHPPPANLQCAGGETWVTPDDIEHTDVIGPGETFPRGGNSRC